MQKILLVIDMQKDFVDGALGSAEALAIVPQLCERVAAAKTEGRRVIFTRDTHHADYLSTQEGRRLPVEHCIEGSEGWQLIPELREQAAGCEIFDKPGFGSLELGQTLQQQDSEEHIDEVCLLGLCTDICVISNAMLLKAFLPETRICVKADCCAGVSPESHATALEAMRCCQIDIC